MCLIKVIFFYHSPIFLDEDDIRKERTSFKFTNMWIKVDDHKDLIKN